MATAIINFRTDEETKEQAAEVFKQLGTDMSGALNMFLRQVVIRKGIPFDISLSRYNDKTLAAIKELDSLDDEDGLPVDEFLAEMHTW
jgi:DNA-damage-inducible protein J